MKRFLGVALWLLGITACDETVVATGCGDISVGATEQVVVPIGGTKNIECVPDAEDMTNTRVASSEFGTIVIRCSYCDEEGCNHIGARCEVAGEFCDFHGDLGMCQPCCDSQYGELHCGPVMP